MAYEADYLERVHEMNRDALKGLWTTVCSGSTPDWAPGKAFEYLILRAFELEGGEVRYPFSVPYPPGIGDGRNKGDLEQIDGAVHAGGLSAIVEAKDSSRAINVEPIAKLRNQLLCRPAGTVGLLFSRSGFTDPARILAHFVGPQTILLWEGGEVKFALERAMMVRGLMVKYRTAVEEGLPDYNITRNANREEGDT